MPGFAWSLASAWAATLAIETAVLGGLLSARHGSTIRLFAGAWLSSCTLPVVWLVFPEVLAAGASRLAYLAAAETFAPLAECGLFWLAFIRSLPRDAMATGRDFAAIVAANLASFAIGEAIWRWLERA